MAKKRKLKNSSKKFLVLLIIILIVVIYFIISNVFSIEKNNNQIIYNDVENFKVINKNLECNDKIISIGKVKELDNIKLAYSCNSEQIVFYKENNIIMNIFLNEFHSFYNVDKYLVIKYIIEDSEEYNYRILDKDLNIVNAIDLDDSVLNEVYND